MFAKFVLINEIRYGFATMKASIPMSANCFMFSIINVAECFFLSLKSVHGLFNSIMEFHTKFMHSIYKAM